ncbi:amidohydrolase family protein [Arthrobacter sp. HS15c]|uniref:amidohydrolase family protein n=1 Tax=Arthrobacter sp. HS15c TaxID=3230279 RepID=UPI0034672F1A
MIVAIGTNWHVLKHANPACQVFDASGMTIVPGFIDPHNHLSDTMLEAASINCSTPPHTSLDEVLATIHKAAKSLAPGEWMRGYGVHANGHQRRTWTYAGRTR